MASRVLKCLTIFALFAWFTGGSVAGAQGISKTVAAGGVLKLGHYTSVNPDCSLLGMPVVRVSAVPMHGIVRTMKTSGFSHFSAGAFDRCNTRRVAGVSVEYRPEKGFAGADRFSLDIIYASGRERTESFAITVK
jgi:hypothetical protein